MDRQFDAPAIERYVDGKWDDDIVPQLVEYIRIPNKSPMFDADWVAARPHGRGGRADGELGEGAGDPRHDGRGRAPGKAARR